jgi:hypothetical protein
MSELTTTQKILYQDALSSLKDDKFDIVKFILNSQGSASISDVIQVICKKDNSTATHFRNKKLEAKTLEKFRYYRKYYKDETLPKHEVLAVYTIGEYISKQNNGYVFENEKELLIGIFEILKIIIQDKNDKMIPTTLLKDSIFQNQNLNNEIKKQNNYIEKQKKEISKLQIQMAEQIKMAEKNNAIIDRAIETLKHHKIKFSPQKILEK